jgi:hypothetical protein
MRDVRKRLKAERNYYQRDEVQACTVCGRLFVRRRGDVCSMACAEKVTERDKKVRGAAIEGEGAVHP